MSTLKQNLDKALKKKSRIFVQEVRLLKATWNRLWKQHPTLAEMLNAVSEESIIYLLVHCDESSISEGEATLQIMVVDDEVLSRIDKLYTTKEKCEPLFQMTLKFTDRSAKASLIIQLSNTVTGSCNDEINGKVVSRWDDEDLELIFEEETVLLSFFPNPDESESDESESDESESDESESLQKPCAQAGQDKRTEKRDQKKPQGQQRKDSGTEQKDHQKPQTLKRKREVVDLTDD
jgi:hypothetical protein